MRQRKNRRGADRNTENGAAKTFDPGLAAKLPLQPIDVQSVHPIRAASLTRAARFEVIYGGHLACGYDSYVTGSTEPVTRMWRLAAPQTEILTHSGRKPFMLS